MAIQPSVEETQYQKWVYATSQGDRKAFEQLYRTTAGKLLAVAQKLLGRKDMAEEIIQETYIKLWHNAASYHTERGSVLTWLVSMVRNRCIDELRHQKVHRDNSDKLPLPTDISPSNSQANGDNKLNQCFDTLQNTQRQSIQLAYFYGLTHQEITHHLEAPLGSIKTWIRRGLEALKRCIQS